MYTVYKTINNITGHYYIGVHKTKYPNDNYFGSGLLIKRAIQKYGKDNFSKIILSIHDEKCLAYEEEKILLLKEINNSACLNLAPGGNGGAFFLGRKHTEKTKQKISKSLKGTGKSARKWSDIQKRNFSEIAKNKNYINRLRNANKKKTQEEQIDINRKISESLKRYWSGRKAKSS